jgi:uncharacterized membrane protein
MKPLNIGLALVFAAMMGFLGTNNAVLMGLFIGYLFGEVIGLKKRLTGLEADISQSTKIKEKASFTPPEPSSSQPEPHKEKEPDESLLFDPPEPTQAFRQINASKAVLPKTMPESVDTSQEFDSKNEAVPSMSIPSAFKRYLTSGNLMVRVGVIVLFFGIAFLVKYAAERNLVPIELRLAAVALFAMMLMVVGWYLRGKRRGYGLALQGGGIGVLYLTIFGAARLYDLIPLMMALGLMISLVGLSTLLALLQDARTLAVLGTVGGFLAPLLTSSGTGNHVTLFSYYLLLNSGILSVAWFYAWRELNLLGFLFTFGIGAIWGIGNYKEHYLVTTEPFLIVFFLIYFLLSILFSLRKPVNLKGYVDGTLVFGLPLTAFGLQSGLVGNTEFGLAISAIFLATLYIFTATILWRLHKSTVRLLIEAFLALGVMFATLAVPLATSGHWTAGTWALEGGALFWIGIRQMRLLSRLAGLILQTGAVISLLIILLTTSSSIAVIGGLLAISGFFVSYLIQRNALNIYRWENKLGPVILALSLIVWLGAGIHDIHKIVSPSKNIQIAIIFVAASLALYNRIAVKLDWSQMRRVGLGLLPFMLVLALYVFEHRIKANPFRQGWWLVWLLNFVAFYDLLRSNETFWSRMILKSYHMMGALLFIFLLTWDATYWVDYLINTTETWPLAIWGLTPGICALVLLLFKGRFGWPLRSYSHLYQHQTVAVILLYLLIWCLRVCFTQGDPDPLIYLPLLNPLDLTILFMFLLIFQWNQIYPNRALAAGWVLPIPIKVSVIGVFCCIWLSALVIRTVHFWGQVPYNAPALATSALLQASLSILWSLYAMGVLFISNKKGHREGWIAGAGLLAIVVIKLFLIDLSGTGTIARIISFVAVGLLMLIIGYFSPLPPSVRKENTL